MTNLTAADCQPSRRSTTWATSKTEPWRATDCGRRMARSTQGVGRATVPMVMVFTSPPRATTRVPSASSSSRVTGSRPSLTAIPTAAIMKPESHMATGSITGPLGQSTPESSRRASVREKDVGSAKRVMSTRAITAQTARTAGGSSSGPTAMSFAESSARTCGRARARCDGPTRAPTRVNGGVDCPTAEPGIFKAKGQKPRTGLFEDNILVRESRSRPHPHSQQPSEAQLLKMIPQVTKRKKSSFKRRPARSVNPSSNSTTMTFKKGQRSSNKSHYT